MRSEVNCKIANNSITFCEIEDGSFFVYENKIWKKLIVRYDGLLFLMLLH